MWYSFAVIAPWSGGSAHLVLKWHKNDTAFPHMQLHEESYTDQEIASPTSHHP